MFHPTTAAPVKSYKHRAKRPRIPTQEESKNLSAREKQPVEKKYSYDPSLDPQLVWTGKKEAGAEFGISTVPIYVQENIAPEGIIARQDKSEGQAPAAGGASGISSTHLTTLAYSREPR